MDRRKGSKGEGAGKPAGWQGGSAGGASRRTAGATGSSRWQQGRADSTGSYWTRLLMYVGLILFCGYALYYYLSLGSQQTPMVALTITRFDDPLIPPNAYAHEDTERLAQMWPTDEGEILKLPGRPSLSFVGRNSGPRIDEREFFGQIQTLLDQAVPGGPDEDTVLLWISTHGMVDGDGEPYLLMSDSQAWITDSWVSVDELVKRLSEYTSPKFDGDLKLIVFLDCTRVFVDSHMGLVYNGFADRLKDVLARHSNRNLAICNATTAGQRAWAAPELNATAFGYYVGEGLNDGRADADGDQIISLGELHAYLSSEMTEWTRVKRTSAQRPMTTSLSDDWESWKVADVVAEARSSEPPPGETPESVTERASKLAQLTDEIETRLPGIAVRENPRSLAELQFRMQRLEQLLWSGKAYETEFQDLLAAARGSLDSITDLSSEGALAYQLTLPDAERTVVADKVKAFRDLWEATPSVPEWQAQAADGKLGEISYDAIAVGWLQGYQERLTADASSWKQHRDLLQLLKLSQPPRAFPDLREVHFMRMLELLPVGTPDGYAAAVLANRLLAEQAAGSTDPRVAYWIQQVMNDADQNRRLSEDQLFVGSTVALAESLKLAREARAGYQKAAEERDQVAKAYRWRDGGYAIVPHFVDWKLRWAHDEPDTISPGDLNALTLLVGNIHTLSQRLDQEFDPRRAGAAGVTPAELAQSATAIYRQLEALTIQFRDRWETVAKMDDQSGIGPGMVMLETPLLSLRDGGEELLAVEAWRRNELRDQIIDLVFHPDDTADATLTGSSAEGSDETAFLKLLFDAQRHPLLALLQRQTDEPLSTPDVVEPERRGTELRDRLLFVSAQGAAVRELLDTAEAVCTELARKGNSITEAKLCGRDVRADVARADSLARAASATIAMTEFLPPTTARLQELDQHFETVWQVYRVLDNFWAGLPDQPEPYFAAASEFMLSATRNRYFTYGDTDLSERLTDYRAQTVAGSVLAVEAPEPVRRSGDRFYRVGLGIRPGASIPPGQSALYLARSDTLEAIDFWPAGREGQETPRLAFAVPQQSSSPIQMEFSQESFDTGVQVEAVALYRGHRQPQVLPLPTSDREQVVSLIPQDPPPPAKVRVHATTKKLTRIVIVLDVSGSMSQGFESREGEIQRWRAAKIATNRLLQTLLGLPQNSYEVAIVAYGHRAGWPPVPDHVNYTSTYRRAMQAEGEPPLHPNEDVEVVQDYAKLTPAVMRLIGDRLDGFEPHGVTPLYYSIDFAINQLVQADIRRDVANHVIVITDGANDIDDWMLDHASFASRQQQLQGILDNYNTADQLCNRISALRRANTNLSIDVIGVLLNNKEDLCGNAVYWQANSMEALIRSLERSLGFHEFAVLDQRSREIGRAQASQLVEVAAEGRERLDYTVQLDVEGDPATHALELEGGEQIELFHNPLSNVLEHRRYRETSDKQNLESTDPRLFISALYPKRRADQTFEFTIQSQDETKFSPRPVGFWATVRPVVYDGALDGPEAYHFYDLRFKPGMPVPVMQFSVPGWPRNIREVAIDLWLRMESDIPADIVREPVRDDYSFANPKLPGINFHMKLDSDRNGEPILIVDETYESNPADLQRARVMVIPPPNQAIRRSLLLKSGGVRHEFHYSGIVKPKFLEITSRQRIQDEYSRLREPVRIALPQY